VQLLISVWKKTPARRKAIRAARTDDGPAWQALPTASGLTAAVVRLLRCFLPQSQLPQRAVELLVLVEAGEHDALEPGRGIAVDLQALRADLLHHALHRRVDGGDRLVAGLEMAGMTSTHAVGPGLRRRQHRFLDGCSDEIGIVGHADMTASRQQNVRRSR